MGVCGSSSSKTKKQKLNEVIELPPEEVIEQLQKEVINEPHEENYSFNFKSEKSNHPSINSYPVINSIPILNNQNPPPPISGPILNQQTSPSQQFNQDPIISPEKINPILKNPSIQSSSSDSQIQPPRPQERLKPISKVEFYKKRKDILNKKSLSENGWNLQGDT